MLIVVAKKTGHKDMTGQFVTHEDVDKIYDGGDVQFEREDGSLIACVKRP